MMIFTHKSVKIHTLGNKVKNCRYFCGAQVQEQENRRESEGGSEPSVWCLPTWGRL